MPRYFYTDYRKALWMATEFGMRLQCFPTPEQAADYGSEEPWDWLNSTTEKGGLESTVFDALRFLDGATQKAYVHPDSLHILERQAGDEMLNIIPTFDIYSDSEIVKRDGKAFFMPEVECATSS